MSVFRNVAILFVAAIIFSALLIAGIIVAYSLAKTSIAQNTVSTVASAVDAAQVASNNSSPFKKQVFDVNGPGQLNIDCACNVSLVKGDANKISVELDADPKDAGNFEVSQKDGAIFVHEKNQPGNTTVISNNSIIVTNGSGRVIVNGAVVTSNVKPTKVPSFVITVPENENIDAKLGGISNFTSSVPLNRLYLSIQGAGKAAANAQSADVSISGSGDVQLHITGGNLALDLSGSGDVRADGQFTNIHASIAGSGDVETEGPVSGDYTIASSGSGHLSHKGAIRGHVHQNANGSGKIDLVP